MSEEKTKRLIVASTVGAVILAFVLVVVMCYQLIAIGVYNNKIAQINAQIAECDRLIELGVNVKEEMAEREWLITEARKLGYIFPGDNEL